MARLTRYIGEAAANRTARDSLLQLAVQVSIVPAGIAILLYLTRRLGPAAYGEYATVMAVIVWIEFVITSLLGRATIKLVAEASRPLAEAAALVRLAGAIGGIGTVFVLLFARQLSNLLGNAELTGLFQLASIDVVLFAAGSAYVAAIAGLGRFGRRAVAMSLRWPLRLALSILLIEMGLGVTGAIWGVIGASIGELVLCAACCPLPIWTVSILPHRLFFAEAMPLFGAAVALRTLDGGDLLMLRALGASSAEAGAYAAAMNLAMLPGMLAMAVGPVLISTIVRLRLANREDEITGLGARILNLSAWTVPPTMAVCLASPTIVSICFGSSFESAAKILQILAWAGLARMVISIASALLVGYGQSSSVWRVCAPVVPLAVLGYAILIPLAGALGAAWATAAASLVGVWFALRAVHRHLSVEWPAQTLVALSLCTAAIAVAGWVWPRGGVAAIAYVVGAATLSFVAMMLASPSTARSAATPSPIVPDANA
jgi:PST family polysaccharide transporter